MCRALPIIACLSVCSTRQVTSRSGDASSATDRRGFKRVSTGMGIIVRVLAIYMTRGGYQGSVAEWRAWRRLATMTVPIRWTRALCLPG